MKVNRPENVQTTVSGRWCLKMDDSKNLKWQISPVYFLQSWPSTLVHDRSLRLKKHRSRPSTLMQSTAHFVSRPSTFISSGRPLWTWFLFRRKKQYFSKSRRYLCSFRAFIFSIIKLEHWKWSIFSDMKWLFDNLS